MLSEPRVRNRKMYGESQRMKEMVHQREESEGGGIKGRKRRISRHESNYVDMKCNKMFIKFYHNQCANIIGDNSNQ